MFENFVSYGEYSKFFIFYLKENVRNSIEIKTLPIFPTSPYYKQINSTYLRYNKNFEKNI